MSDSVFLQPSYEGRRFEAHTLPVEVAAELEALQELVVELAQHLYKEDHPERKRLPKGFSNEFHLHIERIDEGSARPALALFTAASLLSGHIQNGEYFERARDLIVECIASEESIPKEFPLDLLRYFNRFGRSLEEGETVSFQHGNGDLARLNSTRRKDLVLASSQVYEREVSLVGTITQTDWTKGTIGLLTAEHGLQTVPFPKNFEATARKAGGKDRWNLTVSAIAQFDSRDIIKKVIDTSDFVDQPDYQLVEQLDEIAAMKDGWLDGKGSAPAIAAVESVSDALVGSYPEDLPLPTVTPTPEGDLLFEWEVEGTPSLDLCLSSWEASFHSFGPNGEDVEWGRDLSKPAAWNELFKTLRSDLPSIS